MANIGSSLDQYGIELLSFETKKLDLPGIIACVIVALLMGLVSQYICIGLDAYEVFPSTASA